jgi:hypothetical protein
LPIFQQLPFLLFLSFFLPPKLISLLLFLHLLAFSSQFSQSPFTFSLLTFAIFPNLFIVFLAPFAFFPALFPPPWKFAHALSLLVPSPWPPPSP